MKIKTQYIASLAAACVAMSHSHAAVIAEYDFNTDLNASTADANITAGAVTSGAGISGDSGRSSISNSLFALASATSTASLSVGTAIANDDYFSLTIGADSGYYMDLDSITLDYGYTNNGAPFGVKELKAYVFSSFTGFVDASDILGDKVISTTVDNNSLQYPGGSPSLTVDLSAYNYVWSGGEIEFRIYLADTTNNGAYIHRIDNVTLNGVVAAVPEPSSTALLGLGGLALMLRRKRS